MRARPVFSSIKFFAGRDIGHAAVVNYRKWLITLILRKNLLTRKGELFDLK